MPDYAVVEECDCLNFGMLDSAETLKTINMTRNLEGITSEAKELEN